MVRKNNKVLLPLLFLAVSLVLVVIMILFFGNAVPEKKDDEPTINEEIVLPKLTTLNVDGETIEFSPDLNEYVVRIPAGNSYVPKINAVAKDGAEVYIYGAAAPFGEKELCASVYVDDGEYENVYKVKYIRDASEGFVLQYDDRYTFVPNYSLGEGESFVFSTDAEQSCVEVDENGVVKIVGVGDSPVNVYAHVGETLVDTLTVTKTEKAILDIFIVAGQGNAGGEGGNAEESYRPTAGTAYSVELNDRFNEMKDLSSGRQGFTPALAKKWYDLTGEKSLFLQTALSDVSVKQWTSEGEAYKMATDRIKLFEEKFGAEESAYTVNNVICLWLQGEWDIAQNMTSEEYIKYFTDFYENIKAVAGIGVTAVIPVRSSLVTEDTEKDIASVCAAQYRINNKYNDLLIITELPENATVENNFIQNGNLYYTQTGYNLIGEDCANNLYKHCFGENGGKVYKIRVFGESHGNELKNGDTVKLEVGESIQTIAYAYPLYARNTSLEVKFDKNLVEYSEGGLISVSKDNKNYKPAEIVFKNGGVEFKLRIEFYDDSTVEHKKETYVWEFDGLDEKDGKNNLSLSDRSTEGGYAIRDGKIVLNQRQSDFSMEKKIELDSNTDWSIEWSGSLTDNSIILGNAFDTKGFIYLAPFAENIKAVRLTDNVGNTFYLEYKDKIEQNRTQNDWKIGYDNDGKVFSLYLNGEAVSTATAETDFEFSFTNIFGRYGSENVNYCYAGSVDSLCITKE